MEKISINKFPHHIFTYNKSNDIASSPIVNEVDAENGTFSSTDIAKNNNLNNNKNKNNLINNKTNNNLINENKINEEIDNKANKIGSIGAGQNFNEKRASQIKFPHLKIETKNKNNLTCKLASLALNLAKTNKDRHGAIQNFFLINDSTTIATEIPIYLTNWDAGYYSRLEIKDFQRHARWNQKGFIFPLNNYRTPITGHIDILQIRNGIIHILDYKPEADKINAIEQLTIYALALSRKLNLPLYYFKCAWFDENNYFEFFPLHVVYKNRKI